MNDEFNWLEYAEPVESAPPAPERRGWRRFLPRLRRPRLPGFIRRLRLPGLPRLPIFRRRAETPASAADLIAGHEERPVAELDDRLLALRERSGAVSSAEQALSDVDELLVTPEIQHKPGGVISAVALSAAQQQQVEMLQEIVAGPSEYQEEGAGGRGVLRSLPRLSLGGAPRVLTAAFILLAATLPFVSSDFAEGELPPAEFAEDRPSPTMFYDLLDNLSSDDYVLVALEYGPTAAAELDSLTDLFLRHMFAQRAKPVIVSSNPIAIVHAQNIIRRINRSLADSGLELAKNADYFILRYLPGGALGTRELSENFADVARVSAQGALTGLEFESLDAMALLLLVAEGVDDIRNWVEQVLPQVDHRSLLAATGYAAQPLAQAYADSNWRIIGPVVGIRDAYTYAEKLQTTFNDFRPAQPPLDPAREPVVEPVQEVAIIAPTLTEAPDESQAEISIPTPLASATLTEVASASPGASVTPLASATPTAEPSLTPLPSATPEPLLLVVVTSNQQARIRRGPTTADDILQLAEAGDTFEVVGVNGDGSWYNIALYDGLNGWIAAFLVEERLGSADSAAAETPDDTASAPRERRVLRLDFRLSLSKNQPRYYQVNPPDTGIDWEYVLLRDRSLEAPRLQALTLGTLAAVLAIFVGSVVGALNAFRGRPRGKRSE